MKKQVDFNIKKGLLETTELIGLVHSNETFFEMGTIN
jgi:hypothetical protein